ncbi:MAG: AMP-binding protein, partial [Sporomusa sp.]
MEQGMTIRGSALAASISLFAKLLREKDKRGKTVRTIIRRILEFLFKTKVVGAERLEFSGPSIIISNHVSFLDAIFLYAYLPRQVCFVVNTAVADKISFVLRWINHVTIDPLNPYSLKKIVKVIKKGHPIVLFPEGRITTTGGLMKIYSGTGFIALKTDAFVQPVIFRGLERSKLSRLQDKTKTKWLPQVTFLVADRAQLIANTDRSFRLQKQQISDQIATMLQQALFQARQHEDEYTNFFDKLLSAGKIHGMEKNIAEDISGTVNYRQIIIGSYALGQKLKPLLASERNIGILLPNSIGHLVALFALSFLGKTPAILNFSAGAENNLACSETADLQVILTSRAFIEKGNFGELAAQLALRSKLIYLEDVKAQIGLGDKVSALFKYLSKQTAAGDASLILYTSGSESKPKGVVLRHSQILANINQISSSIDYSPRDKMLNALPMFHSFGLTAGTLLPVLNGV